MLARAKETTTPKGEPRLGEAEIKIDASFANTQKWFWKFPTSSPARGRDGVASKGKSAVPRGN